jgi:hypothetical protein
VVSNEVLYLLAKFNGYPSSGTPQRTPLDKVTGILDWVVGAEIDKHSSLLLKRVNCLKNLRWKKLI